MKYILKGQDNKTYLIKNSEDIGNVCEKENLFKLLDNLYNKGLIDLDLKEDLEFGTLCVAREDEFDFLSKLNFKMFDLTDK